MTLSRHALRRLLLAAALPAAIAAVCVQRSVEADQIPPGWAASNMKAIGYSDLGGRGGAFKMAIKQVNGRWYLYMGHLWHFGWSIVDVTDPENPKHLKFIPGKPNSWNIQVELHDNLMLTALQGCAKSWGCDPDKPHDEGVLLWDISDPVNPKELSHWKSGSGGTHRNGYPGGRYAYLSAGMPSYRGQILLILDVSDPKNPKEAGRWWMPGQKEGESAPPDQPMGLHGPAMISDDGNTAYIGYAPAVVILDVKDKAHPKLIGRLDMSPPFINAGGQSLHSVLPIPGKPLLFSSSEASAENCDETLNHAAMIDIKDPTKPRLMSIFPLPVPPKGLPYTNFCDKGGRFGPHNTNQEQHLPDVQKQGDLIYLTYFNAGLQVFDIKDPRQPTIAGYFIPPQPTTRVGPVPAKTLVNQTEDVLVDTRGNIYITDKQWGLFVLRYTGGNATPSTAAR